MTRRDLVLRSVAAAGLTSIALGAVEGAVRFDDWARFNVSVLSNTVSLGELLVIDSMGAHARAGSQFRQFRINSLGFRGQDVDRARLDTAPLVVVSGASESFGLYESAGNEWPRQLEDSLRVQCVDDLIVGNAAFAGMTLPTVQQDIRLRLARLRPSAVVYYPTPMQYLEKDLPVAATPVTTAQPVEDHKRPRLRSLPRVRDAVKRVIPSPVLDLLRQRELRVVRSTSHVAPIDVAPADRLDQFEQGLRQLVGTIRSVGALPVLVIHQNRFYSRAGDEQERWLRAWERFYPLYSGVAIVEFDRRAGERTRQVATDSGALVVDPGALLASVQPPPFADFSHFNDRGSAIVAGTVSRVLSPAVCGRK